MPRSAIENIRLMRYAVTVLLCLCSGIAGFYWAHVLDVGMVHLHGHSVLIGAFFFTLTALVFVLIMETLAVRAVRVAENIRAINNHTGPKAARSSPNAAGTAAFRDPFPDAVQDDPPGEPGFQPDAQLRPSEDKGAKDLTG